MKKIPMSVFEDLQLLCFISRETVNAVRYSCSKENREARRAFFGILENDDAYEKLAVLNRVCRCIASLIDNFNDSVNETEKKLLFVSLMKVDVFFTERAADFSFGDYLTERFSTYFRERLHGKEYSEMRNDLEDTIDAFNKIVSFSVLYDGDKAYISDKTAETFTATIIKCAEGLSVSCDYDLEYTEKRISPDIISYAAKEKKNEMKVVSDFYNEYFNLYSDVIRFYETETDFYISIYNLIKSAKEVGARFCNPTEADNRIISAVNSYDISLIAKKETNIIPNDVSFTDDEPFYYLTGANGGGKTTYLRSVGILTVMYLLGCPVPAEKAEIGGIDSVYTHFPRDERFDGSGRFVEERNRVEKITSKADKKSFVLFNETYSSTNEENAVKMTTELAEKMYSGEIFGLYITHQHGIGETKIPFLKVVIDETDMNRRTFKVSKSRSTGGSFAADILKKYRLTAEDLEMRLGKIAEDIKK